MRTHDRQDDLEHDEGDDARFQQEQTPVARDVEDQLERLLHADRGARGNGGSLSAFVDADGFRATAVVDATLAPRRPKRLSYTRRRMLRTLGAWLLFACVGAAGLSAALASTNAVRLQAESPFAALVWRGFEPLRMDIAARPGIDGQARLHLGGFAPGASIDLRLLVSARAPRTVYFEAPVEVRGENSVSSTPGTVTATATANGLGVLDFTFRAGPDEVDPAALRVHEIEARAVAMGPSLRLVASCGVLIAIPAALLAFLFGPRRGPAAAFAFVFTVIFAILSNRLLAFPLLGLAILVVILGAATKSLAFLFARRFDAPPFQARVLAGGIVVKLAFLSAYTGGDFGFHVNNIERWRSGVVLTSTAPGLERPLPVPYPPALYAVLAAFGNDAMSLKVAMALFELSIPFLVLALARSAGADSKVAVSAAAAAAALPEGLVILAKGVAANMAGQFATIVMMVFLIRRSIYGFALALAVVFLSHLGAALATLPFLALWPFLDPRMRTERSARIQYALGVAIAVIVAWWGYYHSVLPILGGAVTQSSSVTSGAWGIHPIRAGKILQGLVLESALLPLLALTALRRAHPAVRGWFLVSIALGLLAVFSPVMLRFEYFGAPAVAILAAEAGSRSEGFGRLLERLLIGALLLQAALALGFYSGVFPVINLVLESPRWPFIVVP